MLASAGSRRIAVRRGTQLSYLLADHLGSTVATVDPTGSNLRYNLYFPFGSARESTGGLPTDRHFTGQQSLDATGLYNYGARYYDPQLGRFISPDSIVPRPGDPQALNRYSYALNNPLKYRDPTGHWVETAWDVANVAWDVYEFQQDPSLINGAALVVDAAATLLPFVPGGIGMLVRGGKTVARAEKAVEAVQSADNVVEAGERMVDAGVAAYRGYRGGGIHPASTGKAFSDWFKSNILHNAKAKGMNINGGARRLDIVDSAGTVVDGGGKQIYELKNYTKDTSIGTAFWDQAKAYRRYADDNGYTLNYVFGEKVGDSVAKGLTEKGIKVWYIDDAGAMTEWIP